MGNWPKQSNLAAFYGNPDVNRDGAPDIFWQRANLVRIVPPYPMYYPTVKSGKLVKRPQKLSAITCHRKVAPSLLRVLTRIGDELTPDEIKTYELDIFGGCFNFRAMRSGRALSTHSYAAAIDLSHLINRYKRRYDMGAGMMPMRVVRMFEAEGWTWGGLWRTGDAMHFQAADL